MNEPEHKKELSEHKFLEYLKGQARNSHSIAKQAPIFREDHGSDFMLVTPAAREERSQFWVNKLILTSQKWLRFPSRARYLRGYTSIDQLGGREQDHYAVIPLDRSRIGICPGETFYRSFKHLEKNLEISRVDNDGLASWAEKIARGISQVYPDAKLNVRTPESYAEFKKLLREIDREIAGKQHVIRKKIDGSDEIEHDVIVPLKDLLNYHVTSVEDYLHAQMDPEQNGFSSVRIETFSSAPHDREVWIADPCLLVRRATYVELVKQGTIK